MRIHATLFPSGDSFSCKQTTKSRRAGVETIHEAHLSSQAHLGEVADDVRSLFVDFSEDVEDEGLHVKVKRLMVKK